jgi:endonuclease I
VKIQHTSPASKITQEKAQINRIREEIKFLYKQKYQLNRQLYEAHLQAANEWNREWPVISNATQRSIE